MTVDSSVLVAAVVSKVVALGCTTTTTLGAGLMRPPLPPLEFPTVMDSGKKKKATEAVSSCITVVVISSLLLCNSNAMMYNNKFFFFDSI